MTPTFTITADQLSKRFNREWIFRNLSLTFSGGTTYAVTGPNGSGKSTLLQILWGQVPPTSGSVHYRLNGKDLDAGKVFSHVAIATPYLELIDEFTLLEQLRFHFSLRRPRQNLSIDTLMTKMYLNEAADKNIGNFSSGMRQRLKLALAMYTEADAVFLDEPGTNLDQQAFNWYLKALNELPGSCLTVIASNQPSEYPESATKIEIMTFK